MLKLIFYNKMTHILVVTILVSHYNILVVMRNKQHIRISNR